MNAPNLSVHIEIFLKEVEALGVGPLRIANAYANEIVSVLYDFVSHCAHSH
jgi:hypothetical protein